MNLRALKKLLVGVLTVTTVFSTLGSSVVIAEDGIGISQAIVYTDDSYSTDGTDNVVLDIVPEEQNNENNDNNDNNVDASAATDDSASLTVAENQDETVTDAAAVLSDAAGTDDSTDVTSDTTDSLSDASTDAASDTVSVTDAEASDTENSATGVSDDAASEASSGDETMAAAEASSEDELLAAADASSEASSEDLLDEKEKKAALLGESKLRLGSAPITLLGGTPSTPTVKNDLSEPEFGKVTGLVLPDKIDSWNDQFELKFSFEVYNAENIPDGKFTYKLPSELDFSAIAGTTILVMGEDNTQIGTAEVGSDNVITFSIDQNYLQLKPNGIKGSVSLSCKIDTSHGGEEDSIKIIFSDENSIEIKVNDSVVTVTKNPIDMYSGKGKFYVEFNVNTDTKDLEFIDTLGEGLTFVQGTEWIARYDKIRAVNNATFEFTDSRTLKVTIPFLEAGEYKIGYQVQSEGTLTPTTGKTAEELIEGPTRNTVKWSWKGSTNEHIVKSFARVPADAWLTKVGTNKEGFGRVSVDGKADWYVSINGGGVVHDVKGLTLTDTLSAGMVYDLQDPITIYKSNDNKFWYTAYVLGPENFGVNANGQHTLTFKFPDDAEAAFYKMTYHTKIDGTLPTSYTVYSNDVDLSLSGEVIAHAYARNYYDHVGYYAATIDKEPISADHPRDESTGIVKWHSIFTVDGENNNFTIVLDDVIKPADGSAVINGKQLGADIIADSVKLYKADASGNPTGDPLNPTVTYNGNSFSAKIKNLPSGKYVVIYSTQDYYGEKDCHKFPEGYKITYVNKISMTIDERTIDKSYSYNIESAGLPMQKESLAGYYDAQAKTFAIPWKIYVNKNTLGQTNDSIKGGESAAITDYLPKELSYKAGTTKITRNDGSTFTLEPVETKQADGTSKLSWNFTWDRAATVSESNNYYILEYVTYVDKAFFEDLKEKDGDGKITLSFQNNVVGDVGNNNGGTNANSKDEITFLNKVADIDPVTQLVRYSVTINKDGFDLMDESDEIKLKDELTNGAFVVGSLKVYYYGTETEYVLPAGALVSAADGKSFTITLPDQKAFTVKYSVKPDAKQGESISKTQTQVKVSNKATLFGDGNKSSEWTKKYTVDTVSADITSDKGSVIITKVDAANLLKGLAGAEITLYRTDISTGKETKVAAKTTVANDFTVTFSTDGKYDSLIFDTLYYYMETKAPEGYELDTSKYYFIFKGTKYDKVKNSVEKYIKDQGVKSDHYVVLDPKDLLGGKYDVKLNNEKIDRASIKVTKVDSADTSKGLTGAVITLFRTNVNTGIETKVAAKTTASDDYSVTFNADGTNDSLLLDTLYYYSETKAPEGYELDNSKYYFIFKGKQYNSVKSSVEKYIKDQGIKSDHFIVLNPKDYQDGKYGAKLLNEKTDKASVKVTKVDAANTSKGLAGAEITLFRTNVSTGAETKVAAKTTAANDYTVTFNADVASDSLLLDTLYYYSETKAPEGYELDNSKYYFIFKGKQYNSVKNSVEKYIADQGVKSDHFVVLDPKTLSEGKYGATLLNIEKTDKVLITVTKVDAANTSKGLAGAEITLFRTNVSTGAETKVAAKTTAANDYTVTFNADVASDSLLLDTLYYYSETKAPEGYDIDTSKYYFIFTGKNYDQVKSSVERYIAEQGVNSDHYVVLNPKELYQGRFGVMLLNKSKPGEPPENPPSPPDEPPSPPDNPPTPPDTPPTLTRAEEVLGARRPQATPAPQPAVLGARRSRTGDSDMRFAYMGLLGAMAGLVLLTRKRKDQKNKDNA